MTGSPGHAGTERSSLVSSEHSEEGEELELRVLTPPSLASRAWRSSGKVRLAIVVVAVSAVGLALWAAAGSALSLPAKAGSLGASVLATQTSKTVELVSTLPGPEFCTDGTEFKFSFNLHIEDPKVDQQILSSSTDALALAVRGGAVELKLRTYNVGQITTSIQLEGAGDYTISVQKRRESICITICTEGNCKDQCSLSPMALAVANFQMQAPGSLAWGASIPEKSAKSFSQTQGFVPISFQIKNLKLESIWESDEDWNGIVKAAQEAVATLAGVDTTADDVYLMPAGSAGEDGIALQGTVLPASDGLEGSACDVQGRLAKGAQLKKLILEKLQQAKLNSLESVSVASVTVPGEMMSCEDFRCRTSFARPYAPKARCLGGGCVDVCCDESFTSDPLPLLSPEESEEQDQLPAEDIDDAESEALPEFSLESFKPPEVPKDLSAIFDVDDDEETSDEELGAGDEKKTKSEPDEESESSTELVNLTLSFVIENLDFYHVVHECKCLRKVDQAIKEAVAYSAGLSVDYQQVKVTSSPNQVVPEPAILPVHAPREHRGFHAAQAEYDKRVKSLLGGKPWVDPTNEVTEDQLAVQTNLAKLGNGKNLSETLMEQPMDKIYKTERATLEERYAEREKEQEELASETEMRRPHFPFFPINGARPTGSIWTFSQVTLYYIKKSSKVTQHLQLPVTQTRILERISAINQEPHEEDTPERVLGAGDSVEAVSPGTSPTITDFKMPGDTITCQQYVCRNPVLIKKNLDASCFGTDCEATCCDPRPCSQVACKAPMRKIAVNESETCTDPEGCQDTCCSQRCSKMKCPPGYCPKKASWMLYSTPEEHTENCCEPTQCCNAPIATCVACLTCQTKRAYCHSCLWKWLKHRKLSASTSEDSQSDPAEDAALAQVAEEEEKEQPMGFDLPAVTEEEILADEKEIEEERRKDAQEVSLRGSKASEEHRAESELRARRLHEMGHGALLTNMSGVAREERARHRELFAKFERDKLGTWANSFSGDLTVWKAKRHHGQPIGCEKVGVKRCDYFLKSVFYMHCGKKWGRRSANTVQVLTDTINAVSCGDDGICWVWRIRSGVPVQVFVPYKTSCTDEDPGPVYTVSVFFDATYIISAGAQTKPIPVTHPNFKECLTDPSQCLKDLNTVGGPGAAYVWDWKYGHQKNSFVDDDAAILASAELPAWRMCLMGSADGFTTVWNWVTTTNMVFLPYNARSADMWLAYYRRKFNGYMNYALAGMKRLALRQVLIRQETFMDEIKEMNPDLAEAKDFLKVVKDFFHWNTFGAVNSIAITPDAPAFMTGHEDGRVRYWSAWSGTLLMVMQGHQGPVNAVAATPVCTEGFSGGDDGTIRMWNLPTGQQKMLFYQAYGGPVLSLGVIPGGRLIVAGSDDGFIRIWNIKTGLLICGINTGGGPVRGLAINPSNPMGQILTANADGFVRVFNPK